MASRLAVVVEYVAVIVSEMVSARVGFDPPPGPDVARNTADLEVTDVLFAASW